MAMQRRRRAAYAAAVPISLASGYYSNPWWMGKQAYRAGKAARTAWDTVRNATQAQQFPAQPKKTGWKRKPRSRAKPISKNPKVNKEVLQLKKKVREIEHSEKAALGKMTYRRKIADRITVAENSQAVSVYNANTTGRYEAVLANLKYYNPSDPANLVTASAATGTYQKDFLVKAISSKLTLRNNYQSDVEVLVYLCQPKNDTDQSPSAAWSLGIADDPGNITAYTDWGSLPTDYDTFRNFFRTKRLCLKTLSPGQSVQVSHSVNDVFYDPAMTDAHALDYQTHLKAFSFMVIIRGTIGHDTTLDQQTMMSAGVDTYQEDTMVVSYNAGVNLSFVHVDTTLATVTNGAVQSHQPVSDNIGYSVN